MIHKHHFILYYDIAQQRYKFIEQNRYIYNVESMVAHGLEKRDKKS